MQTERISETVINAITEEFERGLRMHLFSDRVYPTEVTVHTEYPESKQTITINFHDVTERIRKWENSKIRS